MGCEKNEVQTLKPVTTTLDEGTTITTISGIARSYSIGVDKDGQIYIPDYAAHKIVIFTSDMELTGIYDLVDGMFQPVSTPLQEISRTLPSSGFVGPHSISFDDQRNMYVTEYKGRRVSKISADGTVVARFGDANGLSGAAVSYFEADGYLYVGNYDAHQIVKLSPSGDIVGWLGATQDSQPYNQWRSTNLPIKGERDGAFDRPHAARLGPDGNIYVVDTWNHRLVKYSSDGQYMGWSGERDDGTVTDGWHIGGQSQASSALGGFNTPVELEFDADGDIYVTDTKNHRIVRMTLDGKTVGWLGAAKGQPPVAEWRKDGIPEADDAPLTFREPYGLRVRNGHLYISDTHNKRVVIISAPNLNIP